MRYWLMKTEPSTFGVEQLAAAPRRTTAWDGVRNYQARNMLRDEMRRGDQAFLYYSSCEVPGIVAIMEVAKQGYPDATAFDRSDDHFDPDSDPARPRWCGSSAAWRASSRSRSCARMRAGSSRAWCCCARATACQ
jgi:predicted RNA-binding protein with PUA-like domain